METKTAINILKEAILLERRGKAFYTSVAEKSDSKAAKEIFNMMAEEEEEHIKFLSRQFSHYSKIFYQFINVLTLAFAAFASLTFS